ncbi:hypothetical protein KI387_000258, partial [Taxus chinensis]
NRLGHLGREDAKDEKANRPKIGHFRWKQKNFQTVWDSWDIGTRGTRRAEGAESQSNNATCLHLKEGQGSPNRVDRRNLSQTVWDNRAKGTRGMRKAGRPADESGNATCHKGKRPKFQRA